MQTFKDKTGQAWSITIDAPTITRVRLASEGQFDLSDYSRLFPITFGDTPQADGDHLELLWYLVERQANERNIDGLTFGKLMAHRYGLHIHRARLAFWAEWAGWLRPVNPVAATAIDKTAEQCKRVIAKLTERLAKEKRYGRKR